MSKTIIENLKKEKRNNVVSYMDKNLKNKLNELKTDVRELKNEFKENLKEFRSDVVLDHTHDVNNNAVYSLYDIKHELNSLESSFERQFGVINADIKDISELLNKVSR